MAVKQDRELQKAISADANLRKSIMSRAQSTVKSAQPLSESLGNKSGFAASMPTASPFPIRDPLSYQPSQPASIPTAGGGNLTMGLGRANVNYPYSYGMMARSPESFASRLPQAPVAPSNLFSSNPIAAASERFRPITGGMLDQTYSNPFTSPTPASTRPSFGLEGGPVNFVGQTPEQKGLIPTAVREGTIYATPQQLANLNARTTAFEGRTPEQQQALLAQMREAGGRMAEAEKTRQSELTRGYYGFIQRGEGEKALRAEAQAAAEIARGGSGRDAARRMQQATVKAEIARQAGELVGRKDQRAPFFSWEPVNIRTGEQFYRGDMGEYIKVATPSRTTAQQPNQTAPSSFWQNAMLGRPQTSITPSSPAMPTGSILDYTPFSSRTQSAAEGSMERFRSAVGQSRASRRQRTVMPVPITSRV